MNLTSALGKAPQLLGALLLLWPCAVVQATWYSENIVGRWIKDHASGQWHLIGVARLPIPATSFTGNSGFLEPLAGDKKHSFTVKQPDLPALDQPAVANVQAVESGGQIAVSWDVPPTAGLWQTGAGGVQFFGNGMHTVTRRITGDFTATCRVDDYNGSRGEPVNPRAWVGLAALQHGERLNWEWGQHFYIVQTAADGLRFSADYSGRLSVWEMGPFEKHRHPVLSPTPDSRFQCPILGKEVRWEAQNVYNPAAVVRDRKVYLFYRADDKNPALKWGRTCRIGMAWSEDGTNFTRHPTPVLYPDNDEWKQYEWEGGCEDLHIVEGEDGVYYMNYTTWSGSADTVSVASSRDLVHWTKHGPAFRKAGKIGGRSGVVIAKLAGDRLIAAKVNGKYWMYYTHPCALAWSENLIDWTPTGEAVWPGGGREAGAIALLRDEGILLMTQGGHPTLGAWVVRQALIDRGDLKSVLQEQKEPFLYPEYDWEKHGFTAATTVANTLVPFKGKWLLYYGGADRCVGLATFAPGAVSP